MGRTARLTIWKPRYPRTCMPSLYTRSRASASTPTSLKVSFSSTVQRGLAHAKNPFPSAGGRLCRLNTILSEPAVKVSRCGHRCIPKSNPDFLLKKRNKWGVLLSPNYIFNSKLFVFFNSGWAKQGDPQTPSYLSEKNKLSPGLKFEIDLKVLPKSPVNLFSLTTTFTHDTNTWFCDFITIKERVIPSLACQSSNAAIIINLSQNPIQILYF